MNNTEKALKKKFDNLFGISADNQRIFDIFILPEFRGLINTPSPSGVKTICVSCDQEKIVHEICLDCAIKLGHDNPKKIEGVRSAEDKELKNLIFTFCEWSDRPYIDSYDHPPALNDRWESFKASEKGKKAIHDFHNQFDQDKPETPEEIWNRACEAQLNSIAEGFKVNTERASYNDQPVFQAIAESISRYPKVKFNNVTNNG